MSTPRKVTGIGGVFMKSPDPAKTREWYNKHLGFDTSPYGTMFEWRHTDEPTKKGTTVWSPFAEDTKHFAPSQKDFMLNLRVENLEWLLGELKKEGIEQIGEMKAYEYGKFAHIIDPDGVKIELWEAVDDEDGKTEKAAK
jgi:predicted enzyme related to lactoylglutathione lyase